ncbi:MAG: hypothetical protein NVS3B12_08190 [Acidimicrobiales bacterium]
MDHWPSLAHFYADDPRRSGPREVEYGGSWMSGDQEAPWRVVWVEATGELFAVQLPAGPVELIGHFPSRSSVEVALRGWWHMCGVRGGLGWLRRLAETGSR